MNEKAHKQIQLAIEKAVDAILSVIELTDAHDRYRETLTKLRDDRYYHCRPD